MPSDLSGTSLYSCKPAIVHLDLKPENVLVRNSLHYDCATVVIYRLNTRRITFTLRILD